MVIVTKPVTVKQSGSLNAQTGETIKTKVNVNTTNSSDTKKIKNCR